MTKKRDSLYDYFYLADRDRKAVKQLFKERHGFGVDDPHIEAEIEKLLREADDSIKDTADISIPAWLVIAIALRPRGRGKGKGKPPTPKWAKWKTALLIRTASRRWAERVAAGQNKKAARYGAALEAWNAADASGEFHYITMSLETLESKMRLEKGRKDYESSRSSD